MEDNDKSKLLALGKEITNYGSAKNEDLPAFKKLDNLETSLQSDNEKRKQSTDEKKKLRFDDIVMSHLRSFGKYQKLLLLLVSMPAMLATIHSFSWTFIGAKIRHKCLYAGQENNDTEKWYHEVANVTKNNQCERIANVSVGQPLPRNFTLEPCLDGYIWDHSDMTYSGTERWSLACDRDILRPIIQSTFYVGQFFGSLILGMMADRIGRKPVFMFSILGQIVCGVAMAFVPYWSLFAALRVFDGFWYPGIFTMAIIISAEMASPKYRVLATVSVWFFDAMAETLLGALAYPLRNYQYLQLSITLPALLFLAYWWVVPESPRWLISQGRPQDADRVLQRVIKFNNANHPLPHLWYDQLDTDEATSTLSSWQALCALFRTPNLRKRTLISCLIWSIVSMNYYGLATNPGFMGGDNRVGFIVGGLLEIPGVLVVWFLLNTIGRKYLTCGMFLLSAVSLIVSLAIPTLAQMEAMMLVIFGKNAIIVVFTTVYIMTPEHYPTAIRNTATGLCSMVARIGCVSSSFISMYVADKHPSVAAIIYAGLALLGAVASLFLPETTGEPLAETIEEGEALGANQPVFISGRQNEQLVARRRYERLS